MEEQGMCYDGISVVEQDLKPMRLSEFPHWGFAHVYTILGGVWKATEPSLPYQCLWMAKLVLCFWWILEVIRGKPWQDSFKKWDLFGFFLGRSRTRWRWDWYHVKICERHDLRHFFKTPDVLRVKCTSSRSTPSLSPVPWLDLIGGTCLACHTRCHKLPCCLKRLHFHVVSGCFMLLNVVSCCWFHQQLYTFGTISGI